MSILITGLMILTTSKITSSLLLKKHSKRFISKYFDEKISDDFLDDYVSKNKLIKIDLDAIDGEKFSIYKKVINDSNDFIVYVPGFLSSINQYDVISKRFEDLGYNSIFIKNRNIRTFGIKEPVDLLTSIDYLVDNNPNINLILFGESDGANIIIKALESKLPNNVSKIIVDSIKTNYLNSLIYDYCQLNDINNLVKLNKEIYNEIENNRQIDLNDTSIEKSLNHNSIPICFVHSKLLSRNYYYDMLKIYNSNYKNQKIFFSNSTGRNFLDEKYFEVLKKFINDSFD